MSLFGACIAAPVEDEVVIVGDTKKFNVTQRGFVLAEYVWLGGSETCMGGFDLRSKTKTLEKKPTSVSELPVWNYDGSSTEQAPGSDSEVLLVRRRSSATPSAAATTSSCSARPWSR